MLITPCALAIIGKPAIATPVVAAAAPVRNLRRDAPSFSGNDTGFFKNFLSIASSILRYEAGKNMLLGQRQQSTLILHKTGGF
jgi:hypothetical protein